VESAPVLTTGEVSAVLRVSEVTARRMVRRGVLPRVPGLRVVLIPRVAVERMVGGERPVR
jgi:excisionase family DNA binding protein